jgi:hypothetical protein
VSGSATALKLIPSLTYSIARLRVNGSKPRLVIIGTNADSRYKLEILGCLAVIEPNPPISLAAVFCVTSSSTNQARAPPYAFLQHRIDFSPRFLDVVLAGEKGGIAGHSSMHPFRLI